MIRPSPKLWCAAFTLMLVAGCHTNAVVWPPSSPTPTPWPSPTPATSIAIHRYTGREQQPVSNNAIGTEELPGVTLAPNVKVTKAQLMTGVNKQTLLIVLRNRSNYTFDAFTQVQIMRRDGKTRIYGRGPLLPGEQRIIKAHGMTPAEMKLFWTRANGCRTRWESRGWAPGKIPVWVPRGIPIELTFIAHDKVQVKPEDIQGELVKTNEYTIPRFVP